MRHYFLNSEKSENDYFTFKETFHNHEYIFNSSNDVFSKNHIDIGTKSLLNTVLDENYLNGHVLDFGCGYGVIGIVLKRNNPKLKITFADINKTAIKLTKENVLQNLKSLNDCNIVETNLYENINDTFDHVVTNPPIKVGKQILFEVVTGAFNVLKSGGTLTLVIRKDHGAESMKKHMISVFNNAEILNREKGFYILRSVKE